jgi:hypothetical protein
MTRVRAITLVTSDLEVTTLDPLTSTQMRVSYASICVASWSATC